MDKPNPYLIQRCRVKTRKKEDITGIDSLLHFDYMGSSEFEWGAIPKALKQLCAVADELVVWNDWNEKGVPLFLVCVGSEMTDAQRMLKLVSSDKHRTKEYVGIAAYLSGKDAKEAYRGFDAWWDIEHRWMVFRELEVAKLAIQAIKHVRDRWKAEGKL